MTQCAVLRCAGGQSVGIQPQTAYLNGSHTLWFSFLICDAKKRHPLNLQAVNGFKSGEIGRFLDFTFQRVLDFQQSATLGTLDK